MDDAGGKGGWGPADSTIDDFSGAHDDALDTLLRHLQGNAPHEQADAGLARLSAPRLAAIQRGAQLRADGCLRALGSTARLLAHALEEMPAPPESMRDLVGSAHLLGQLVDDLRQWQLLAEHAEVYRTQPNVADQVCRRWGHTVRQSGEWPAE